MVSFEASKFIFQAPLLVLCSRKRRVPWRKRDTGRGIKPEQAPLLQNQGAYINPVCIRRRPTRTIGWAKTIWFCSSSFVRRPKSVHRQIFESRQLSKILSLSLLDRRVLAKGLSHARDWNNFWSRGTDSRGTESNNFVVAQPTTYYLLGSYLLLVSFSFYLRRQLLHIIVRPYHGVDRSPDYRFL